ncbi:MAG TPA: histone deacetylase, partial [Flavobacteriales bacterium]|nr:histone deacetylase [Flavobacteriales bacterium]
MDVAYAPCYVLDVPEGHRFPMQKYALLRAQ